MDEWSDKNSFASIFRAGAAEAVGTFLLVFTGCAAVVSGGGLGDNQVAWAVRWAWMLSRTCTSWTMILLQFGLAFMVLCFATADVSGGHLNPAVSIAFAVTQDIDVQRCAVYIICQCLGAVFGALFLKGACSFCVHSLANGRRDGMSACNDANSLFGMKMA
jgi:glycerol uptake facilitator-like aquaporin